jgi:chromatin structure-remodeling complex subunit RSC1/2
MQAFQTPRPAQGYQQPYAQQPPAGYKAPQPVEVYVMNDHANASIPPSIREQFQRDEKGRVLFFTAPPLNVEQPLTKNGRPLGHSARYLAAKAKKDALKASKRKADEANMTNREEAAKKTKADEEAKYNNAVSELGTKALNALQDQLAAATKYDLECLANGKTKQLLNRLTDGLVEMQRVNAQRTGEYNMHLREREDAGRIKVTGMTARLEEKY